MLDIQLLVFYKAPQKNPEEREQRQRVHGVAQHHREERTRSISCDKRKPPLPPPRSPFIRERKIKKKIRDDDIQGIIDSVIAAVSNASLNVDTDDDDNDEVVKEVCPDKYEVMKEKNARMDNMWENVINSSQIQKM